MLFLALTDSSFLYMKKYFCQLNNDCRLTEK